VLSPRRVYILPSRLGVVFALVLVAMLIGAINYGNSLAYALTFLLASVSIVSTLHTYRNLRRLRITAAGCAPVFQGEPAKFGITVANPGQTPRFAVSIANMEDDEAVIDLSPGATARVELARTTRRRGRLAQGRLTVSSRYPLGLFRAWAYVDTGQRCLVYPAPAPDAPEGDRRGAGHVQGARRGAGSEEFGGFRRYQPGDSLRHVHWKAFAGGRELLTKQFEGEAGEEHWLSYEALEGDDPEQRLRMLCRMLLDAETSGERYTLEIPGHILGPGQGSAHLAACLEALALFGGEGR
jgi:uncharacterized protein (DUF58 family)